MQIYILHKWQIKTSQQNCRVSQNEAISKLLLMRSVYQDTSKNRDRILPPQLFR